MTLVVAVAYAYHAAVVSARLCTELDRPEVAGIAVAGGVGAVSDFHTVVHQTALHLFKQFMVGKGTP